MGKTKTKTKRRKNRTRTNFYKIRRAQNKTDPLITKVSIEKKIRAMLRKEAPEVQRLQGGVIEVTRQLLQSHLVEAFQKAYLARHEDNFKTIKEGALTRHCQNI